MAYGLFGAAILLLVTPLLGLLLRDYPQQKGLSAYGEEGRETAAVPHAGVAYARAVRMPAFYGMMVFAFLMISVSTLNLFIPNYVTSLG